MPADLILYALIAAGLVVWLRGTLGTRQEGDEPAKPPMPLPDIEEASANAPAAIKDMGVVEPVDDPVAALAKSDIVDVKDDAKEGLQAILAKDPAFDLKFFTEAVQDAFVMIIEAFADGDRDALGDMLTGPVYKAFDADIQAREDKGTSVKAEIHAIKEAHIIEARLNGKQALITLRFVAEESRVVSNADGEVMSGDAAKTHKMVDIWTFSRTLKSNDPRWLLSETRGDFEDDNDFVPNAE